MAVFHAVERGVWKRALFMVLLLLAAGTLYIVSEAPFGSFSQSTLVTDVQGSLAPTEVQTVDLEAIRARVTVEPLRGSSFDEYRMERERSRSMQMEQLRELLETTSLSAADQQMVSELLALLERTEQELQSEGLLRARGLSDALVVVADSGVIVVVSDAITQSEAGSIGSVITQVTGVPLERITISDGSRLP